MAHSCIARQAGPATRPARPVSRAAIPAYSLAVECFSLPLLGVRGYSVFHAGERSGECRRGRWRGRSRGRYGPTLRPLNGEGRGAGGSGRDTHPPGRRTVPAAAPRRRRGAAVPGACRVTMAQSACARVRGPGALVGARRGVRWGTPSHPLVRRAAFGPTVPRSARFAVTCY